MRSGVIIHQAAADSSLRRYFALLVALLTGIVWLCLGTGLPIATASPPEQAGNEPGASTPVVVRAYFDDPALVRELARWKEPWDVNRAGRFVVVDATPEDLQRLLAMGFRVKIDERRTRELTAPRLRLPFGPGIPGYACYRTVEETYTTAEELAVAYPTLASWLDIGDSWLKTQDPSMGYDLQVLRLTNGEIPGPKPALFVVSTLHAREYATAELVTRFAEQLASGYGRDADITWMLDYHEIHLLLHANPDGRKEAEQGEYWRKNANNNFCSNTPNRGVDLNRNFSFAWGCCGGSSPQQCSGVFRGPAPSSEPETLAIEAYTRSLFPDQRGDSLEASAPLTSTGLFLDIHSYGGLVLWPWGFTEQPAPNASELQTLGRKFAFFNDYYPEQAIGLYPTDGTTDDFVYGELGVPAYTWEIGDDFFQACESFESTILPQNLAALLYAAKVARAPYLEPRGPDATGLAPNWEGGTAGVSVTVEATFDDGRYSHANGSEPAQPIAAAEYYLDTPPWAGGVPQPLSPLDGAYDSSMEAAGVTLDLSALAPGRHTLWVRARDGDGNWGPASAAFLQRHPLWIPVVSR